MDRTEFIIATAIILFAVFLLGWCASWLVHRLSRVTRADMGELVGMAQQLHEAEEARDHAISGLEMREAELGAARNELLESRREIEELRAYIDRKLARKT